ncbi:CHAT domain-containing protein [Aureispira anguillae]|uniref:CHAT domain-containing protein n=1 Tax=Aureispira anguillae TaxID=2864201 RepID=A0A915YGQ3_9BACT|nr:CHAT domain-containing tetratricopeptide repeat protein [Aureispira anguillae]BDS12648.1 CHAT domain-containing protein [Aureispira anguillae]
MNILPLFCFLLGFFLQNTSQANPDTTTANQFAQLAQQQQQSGQFMMSNQNFEKAAVIFEQAALWNSYINCQNQMARNYWKMHKLDSSLALSTAIEKHSNLVPQSLEHAELLSNIGVVYDMQSDYNTALKYFHQCLDIRKKKLGEDHFETGKIYYNIGVCYSLQRNMNTAIEYFENTVRNFKKNLGSNHPYLITVYLGMRDPYSDLGRKEEAIKTSKEALVIAKKVYPSGHLKIATVMNSIGLTYLFMKGKEEKGKKLIEEAFQIQLKKYGANNPKMIRLYTNMGKMYTQSKHYSLAKEYLFKGLDLAQKTVGKKHIRNYYIYQVLADVTKGLNQDSMTVFYGHRAMLALLPAYSDNIPLDSIPEFTTTPIIAPMLLASAYATKTFSIDKMIANNPSAFNKQLYQKHLRASDLLLARLRQDIHNLDDLNDIFYQGYKNTLRKVMFYRKLDPEKEQTNLLEELIEDADQNKSALLKLALKSNNALKFGGVPDRLINAKIELKKTISKVEQQLFRAKEIADSTKEQELSTKLFQLKQKQEGFNTVLKKEHPQYFQLQHKNTPTKVQEIQEQLLDDSTMLIEYMYTKGFLYVFCVGKHKVDVDVVKIDPTFHKNLDDFRFALTNIQAAKKTPTKAHAAFSDNAYYFYEILLKKYIDPTIKNLILIPDKQLNRLPFEAFLYESNSVQSKQYKDLKYLINKYNIRYAYSAGLLINTQQKQAQSPNHSNKIAAFAASYNPATAVDPLRAQLLDLPGARKEVLALQEQFEGAFFLGQEATEANFNPIDFKQFSVVHLAMHSIMDKKNPMNSCMAFTKDSTGKSKEDDWVYAYELTNMKIATNLVVLSACETGDGQHQKVEGIMSIGRSFMYAGVPSLIMTLWQVNDFSTAKIMGTFYKELAKGKSKSAALRSAKLDYIRKLKKEKDLLTHPYFWAAFINLGDDSNIPVVPLSTFSKWWYGLIGLVFLVFFLVRRFFLTSTKKHE